MAFGPTFLSASGSGSLVMKTAPSPVCASASGSRGLLVMATGGLSTRLMLVPAGSHLPLGVHAVAAVPAAAGSSRRRGMLVLTGAAGAEAEPGNTAGNEDPLDNFVKTQAIEALGLLARLAPTQNVLAEARELEDQLYGIVTKAKDGKPNKMEMMFDLIRAAYGIVEISKECFPPTGAPLLHIDVSPVTIDPLLPFDTKDYPAPSPPIGPSIVLKDGSVQALDFGPAMTDTDAVMRSVKLAMALAIGSVACVSAFRAAQ